MFLKEKQKIINAVRNNQVGVIPTDTIYGLVGTAMSPDVVERIFELKGREKDKPLIILIGDVKDLNLFGINLKPELSELLEKLWEYPVSVVLQCKNEKFEYLNRGTKTLAFRLPRIPDLKEILKQTGPIVAPSANPEMEPPATTISKARDFFGDKVDFYIEGWGIEGEPSTVVQLKKDGKFKILREGIVPEETISSILNKFLV